MRPPGLPVLLALPDPGQAPAARWLEALGALARLAPPGALGVQVRLPHAPARDLLRWGRALRDAAPRASLWVNDRLDVAAALDADGVHLGRASVGVGEARALLRRPGLLVSRSCHDDTELAQASREGADLVLLSPIFASPGKGPPLGLPALRRACVAYPALPILALGGVDASTLPACLDAGAHGVAAIRALLDPAPWPGALSWPLSC